MKTIFIYIGLGIVLILLLKVWNKYSRIYNHKILTNSRCKNCKEILGSKALKAAIIELEKEKTRIKQEAKVGTVTLHNMKLICKNCDTENYERDLYKTNRDLRKNTT